MNKFRSCAAALALVTMVGAAPAALVLQSNNLEVLDTDTNLLWLYSWRDDLHQLKTWAEGNAWAAALTVGGAAAAAWRMPMLSELEDLWADPAVGQSLTGLRNHFTNVESPGLYWTGTSDAQDANRALIFSPLTGGSIDFNKNFQAFTVAVRNAATGPGPRAVAEPHSAALALLGLGAVALHRRRRQPSAAVVAANKPSPTAVA